MTNQIKLKAQHVKFVNKFLRGFAALRKTRFNSSSTAQNQLAKVPGSVSLSLCLSDNLSFRGMENLQVNAVQ
jgi:hypothetical protein